MLGSANRLDQCQSSALAFSDQLAGANTATAPGQEQITNLTQQIAMAKSENVALSQRMTGVAGQMNNQIAALNQKPALTETNLAQASQDCELLENRFRIGVAERVVLERKFNNPAELQGQLQNLKSNPAAVISAGSIYASLDIEVKTNRAHVITPN